MASLTLACAGPDGANVSPFPLWGQRVGTRLDGLEQFFLRQDNVPWGRCDTLAVGLRRCSRYLSFPVASLTLTRSAPWFFLLPAAGGPRRSRSTAIAVTGQRGRVRCASS